LPALTTVEFTNLAHTVAAGAFGTAAAGTLETVVIAGVTLDLAANNSFPVVAEPDEGFDTGYFGSLKEAYTPAVAGTYGFDAALGWKLVPTP
jgi:hypothetical protein